MKSRIYKFVFSFIIIFFVAVPVYASDDIEFDETNINISDYENLFSDEEEKLIHNQLEPLSVYGKIFVVTYNTDDHTVFRRDTVDIDYIYRVAIKEGNSGLVILIDTKSKSYVDFYMLADGDMRTKIGTYLIPIVNNVYPDIESKNYYKAVSEAISEIQNIYKTHYMWSWSSFLNNLLIAFIISVIGIFIIVIIPRLKYMTTVSGNVEYTNKYKYACTHNDIIFKD